MLSYSLHVIFMEVFNNNTNNYVTSIAAKSLQIRLRGASTTYGMLHDKKKTIDIWSLQNKVSRFLGKISEKGEYISASKCLTLFCISLLSTVFPTIALHSFMNHINIQINIYFRKKYFILIACCSLTIPFLQQKEIHVFIVYIYIYI